ncbi:peptidase S8/S53 domain-containing protein [Camillea tinctor]|nr:peptidase S8/S53 domain-containing protein [Camillea tinctor]
MRKHRWVDKVTEFARKYVEGQEQSQEVKVALIDDGVSPNEELRGKIHSLGWPRQNPTDLTYPWYRSITGHGTEMARLIRMLCPQVKLYVAKISQWSHEGSRPEALAQFSTASTAAEAVAWAIEQKVDIISMSWNLIRTPENKDAIKRLDLEIQKASNQGIIMFCAAADQSLYGGRSELYPVCSDTEKIFAVGSADPHGAASAFVNPQEVEYLFPGESINISTIKEIKGSSVATALATGFAALILWCFGEQRGGRGMDKVRDPKVMRKIFDNLKVEKFVDATILLGSGKRIKGVKEVVDQCRNWIKA